MDTLLNRRGVMMGQGKEPQQYVVSLIPSSYESPWKMTNPANGYTDENSTTYASNSYANQTGERYFYFKFNTSAIPPNAVIDSVVCKAKGTRAYGTFTGTSTMQMYSGATPKGSEVNINPTPMVFTFSGVAWDRSEVSDVRIKLTRQCDSGTVRALCFYGATLTITYTA